MRTLLAAWMIGACALLQGAQALPLYTDDNMPAPLLAELMRGQDLAMELRFDEAEAVIRGIMLQEPEHPLGDVFLLATLLSRTQEEFRAGRRRVDPAFIKQADALIAKAKAQQDAYPHSAYPRYYMAAGLGVRGLARLYAGSYFSSYRDGKRGAGLLKEAVAIEPELYNAYMGLGQFEYYCGTLGSVLQFLLALPGDPDQGLAMLKTCADRATYAAWPCRAYRVRLIVSDRQGYAAVEPELPALVARYPGNYDFALAVFAALDAKVNTAALRGSAEEILRRVRHGWSPPVYARFDPQAAELSLALAYLEASQRSNALPHLEAVSRGPRQDLAQRAQDLLAKP
jgi:hypothetical protein